MQICGRAARIQSGAGASVAGQSGNVFWHTRNGNSSCAVLYQGPERLYSGKISCKVQRSSGRKPFSYMCILHQL